jgi:hypothetical protein
MRIIEPDFDRSVTLPGAGLMPRPVEIGPAETGFSNLLGLRIDEIPDGSDVKDEVQGEVLLILLAGAVTVEVGAPVAGMFQLDADGDWALHLPPGSVWRLWPLAPATLARATARATRIFAPHAIRPEGDRLAFDGPEGCMHLRLHPLGPGEETEGELPVGIERLLHLCGPAQVEGRDLPPMHSLALSPGEATRIAGQGEFLAVGARGA